MAAPSSSARRERSSGVAASELGHVVALFSQRAKASDSWKVVLAELASMDEVKRSELPTGPEEAQGPGIAKADERAPMVVALLDGLALHRHARPRGASDRRVISEALYALHRGFVEADADGTASV